MNKFVKKLLERLGEQYHFYTEDNGILISFEDVVSNIKAMAEEYEHCCLCYFGAPCEYQNEEARLPASQFANDCGWIPCSEMLPTEKDGTVVICESDGNVMTGRYSEFSERWYKGDMCGVGGKDVIAWQPLPAPYVQK